MDPSPLPASPSIADAILAADDLPRVCVHDPAQGSSLPGWESVPGPLFVRTMMAEERDDLDSEQLERREKGGVSVARMNFRARLAVLTLVDAAGQRVFRMDQADGLGKKSASALDAIFDAAARLNGLTARDVKELEKN